MANNRYVGGYPVIGIRPIVDGRRGPMMLRESLEPLVWSMAEAAKSVSDYEENGQNIVYISVMNNMSIDCDCVSKPTEVDMHDIGILASKISITTSINLKSSAICLLVLAICPRIPIYIHYFTSSFLLIPFLHK